MLFKDCLAAAMREKNMTGSDLSRVTGIGKSSISQYLTGKNLPSAERMRVLEEALGADFSIPDIKETPEPSGFHRAKVNTVARAMGMNAGTLRKGIRQGAFPWAYGIRTSSNRWVYVINQEKLEATEGLRL